MAKKTIKELAAMSGEEVKAYFRSLSKAERKVLNEELNQALEVVTTKNFLENLHKNTNNS